MSIDILYLMKGVIKMGNNDYYVGLDMGTASVGWAVTDTKYNLLRAKGKDMWGVRLFSEAETAADRRSHRVSRRNINRRKARIGLLKEIFETEINKVDPGFYERLRDSKFYAEDKETKNPFAIFSDTGYTDVEFHQDYPTIFHLISELVSDKGKEPHDVRLVFLACLNIYKHRGHFLNDTLSESGIDNIDILCKELCSYIDEYNQYGIFDEKTELRSFVPEELSDVFEKILCNKKISNSSKKSQIINEFELTNKNKYLIEMIGLVCGLTVTISNIFSKDEYDEEQLKQKLSFRSSQFDEDILKVESMLNQDEYEIICLLKKIHDWSVVSVIMGKHQYLSDARVEAYNKHKADLLKIKKIYIDYAKDKYDDMFRDMSDNNYSAYVGKVNSNKASQTGNHKTRMQRRGAKCKLEDLYSRIKKDLINAPENEMKEIYADMEANAFLPKQLTNENGVIPYQLHKSELIKILDNASEYLDFLNIIDDTGLSNKDKIISLFEFRIPYYIGPLYKDEKLKTNAWIVRKEKGRVYPWNFESKVNVKLSAEAFIERMIKHCTYLQDECALPKNSLKYERFRVLNELNSLSINGERVSVELKQRIYNDLFKRSKKRVTKSMLCSYLYNNGLVDKDVEVSGFDGTFANALLSYGKFRELFGVDTLSDSQENVAENIIKWSTIYGDSKKFLKEKIIEAYGSESENPILDKKQIERACGYKFTDWGRLSEEFLKIEGEDKETKVILPLITRMWEYNYNLQELLSNRFTYRDVIENRVESVEKTLLEIEYEDIDNLYISAPVKRMTWQTLLILKEIYEIKGYAPKKLFIEMARDDEIKINGKGKRKNSRKQRLEDLYKNCKEDSDKLRSSLKGCDESSLRSKKLYLYYMQKGKCMYSGNTIDIDALFTNQYDIDHIYPQSVVKDDSLDNNLVLVDRNYNNIKSDTYPIPDKWRNKMRGYWDILKREGFLNDEKYKRLTRAYEFTDDELADFVNRQLVETRQATKVVAELIKKTFSGTEDNRCKVVYAKADNVSRFRHKFSMKYDKKTDKSYVIHPELVKCRIINDFHHAYDAYLNIVVGNVYDVKFTQNPYNYIKEYKKQKRNLADGENEKYHMDKIFNYDVKRGDETAWVRWGDNKSLDSILKVLRKNTPLVTRMNYEAHGKISKETIWSAEKAQNGTGYISVKSNNKMPVNRYGGYSSLTTAYFFLVEHTSKKKRIRTIEAFPLYLKDQIQTKEMLEEWCADKENGLGLIDPSVRFQRIKVYSKIRIDGYDLCLTGKGGNALLTGSEMQLKVDSYWRYYIKKLSEYTEKSSDIITIEDNIKLYDLILDKNINGIYSKRPSSISLILNEGRDKFISLSLEEQVSTLMSLLKEFCLENQGLNLLSIGGSKRSGVMQPNKNITDRQEVLLINQSVTGLYENTIDLLTI